MTTITPQNVLRHELIGLNVAVVQAGNSTMMGVRGEVIDETKNMLTVSGRRGTIMIAKNTAVFRFVLPSGVRVDVDGKQLVAKPENRLKTKVRRW
jgi:ribonuclease P protein subunit POP4